jgi:hypothetical protein
MLTGTVYSRRQIGWLTGGVPLVSTLGVAVFVGLKATIWLGIFMATLAVIPALLFGALTVTVDQTSVRWAFGIGLIRKRMAIREIRSIRIVTTPWYAGWGIRLVPGGWLYNVAGRQAVELTHVGDGRTLLGTNDPSGLYAALRACGVGDANRE